MECPQTKKGIKIIPVILVLEIIATIILMLVINSIWSDSGQEWTEYGIDVQNSDADAQDFLEIIKDQNERIDKTQTASMIYYLVETVLALIMIYGSYQIYEESKNFGDEQNEKAKWGLILVVFFGITVLARLVGSGGLGFVILSHMGLVSMAVGLLLLIYHLASENDLLKLKIGAGIMCSLAFLSLFISPFSVFGTFVLVTFLCGYILMIVGYAFTLKKLEAEYPSVAKPEKPVEKVKGEPEVTAEKPPEKLEIIAEEKPESAGKETELDLKAYDIPELELKDRSRISLEERVETILEEKVDKQLGVVDEFSEKFGISGYHAQLLRDADYRKIEDLKDATREDLMMVKGINPTVARKIIGYFK